MTSGAEQSGRVSGSLRVADGAGVVRLEVLCATGIDDVWSALTDPQRLAGWLGQVEGELREGGRFQAHYLASGWEGTGSIEACEPPRRLVVATAAPDEPASLVTATLTAEGELTRLVVEISGLAPGAIAAYAAGNQVHVEDLVAHLAGRGRCDAAVRWEELHAEYQLQAAASS